MKKLRTLIVIFALIMFACSSKHDSQKAAENFHSLIKNGKFEEAWDMTDKETKELVPKEQFLNEAKRIKSLALFTKVHKGKVAADGKSSVVDTKFFGKLNHYNDLPKAAITFHMFKVGEKWVVKMKKIIDAIVAEQKAYDEACAFTPEVVKKLQETAKLYGEKIEVKDLKNGEVTFTNGMSQYMMEATVKNNTDKPLSYVGVQVQFLDDAETKVLFEKLFFIVYTRVVNGKYPIKPGEERSIVIPGIDGGDIEGNWNGKLKWEVAAVKVATEEELITLD